MKQLFLILLIICLFLTSCGKTSNLKTMDTQNSSEKSVTTKTESASSDINSSENSIEEASSSEISSSQSSEIITSITKYENSQQSDIIIRESLSKDIIECVAYDVVALLSLFYDGTYSINQDEAEHFILMLIAQTSEKYIIDNYVPNLYSYISPEKTKIVEPKINGEYVKILMKAIFDYEITPKKEYDYPIGDPAPFGLDLKSLKNEKGKYYAKFYLSDVDGTPYHEIEMTFSLTPEGNTRIEPIVVRSLNDEEIKEAVATMTPYEDD